MKSYSIKNEVQSAEQIIENLHDKQPITSGSCHWPFVLGLQEGRRKL